MRLLYDIDADLDALLSQVDEETGELLFSLDDLEALQMEREAALEGIALTVKNLTAEAAALKGEIDNLTKRKRQAEARAERLTRFLQDALAGEKLKTSRVAVSYRSSKAVEIRDEIFWQNPDERFLRMKPEVNRTAIKEALEAGETIPGAEIVTRQSMQIK